MPATVRACRPPVTAMALGLLALLQGCSLRAPEPAPADWGARREQLMALAGWDLRGRIAVKANGGGGQGDLHWHQQGPAARIRLSGPFGAGAWEIDWDPGVVTVRSRNGEFTRQWQGEAAAGEFLESQLGWSFPAASTRYWLLALPDPGSVAAETFAADGRLATLEQNGWTVTYQRYTEAAGIALPSRMELESGQARLRVVIDRWRL